jgi:hypothetical protein
MRGNRPALGALTLLVVVASLVAACSSSGNSTTTTTPAAGAGTAAMAVSERPAYLVYWDQNEEVDFLSMPSGTKGVLVPPWDLNGQMCILPDGSGRFVGGYNPTGPDQNNPGSLLPHKQPPIGEELDRPNGSFSGQTLYVPGPYKFPGQTVGGDSPPSAKGSFNANSTYTGCVFDRRGDLLANDIGTAQGSFPPPANGRLVEWFAPSYKQACIVDGPTAGGAGPHHVDGTGGLSQPGMLTLADNGDVLMPEAGSQSVLRFDHTSLPSGPTECPGNQYPAGRLKTSVFFEGNGTTMPFPAGIAKDPTCDCFAISSYFGNPSILWVSPSGAPITGHASIPGETIAQLGQDPNGFNPFGLAFAPDGTLYFVDIHITCKNNMLTNCGPTGYGGRVMQVTFTNGQASAPTTVSGGFDFPTSVTVCLPAHQNCPYPQGTLKPPSSGPSENPGHGQGPYTTAPATAGFGH